MRKKKYTAEDLNEQFQEIYNDITKLPLTPEELQEAIDCLYPDEEEVEHEDSLLTIYKEEKFILKRLLSIAVESLKGEYNDEFSIEVGKLGGKLGGLKRRFLQNCKIFVIHKLFPNSNFSGNALIEISEALFGKGINRSFLHSGGHALGTDALFSGKSDAVPDISDEQQKQSRMLMDILKRMA
ncbi:hypothetical protein JK202_14985 [Gluconobacter sp. Dm-62]|uniref:hypothetical protein n=1 Tax=Gluconobacter sp. Dm-62 TaxID=2799804 RepID=UPI001B8B0869|nr:hypothetical protein [Gluconobacter sp. Dm-62]MBS1104293.1 hypothetical protein [Gluconobacter sp. Dm-62]